LTAEVLVKQVGYLTIMHNTILRFW